MPKLRVNGLDINLRETGEGPGVVLLHSSSSSGGQWRGLMDDLEGRFHLLAPDLLGYGKSDPLPTARGTTDLDEELALIMAVIDRAGPPVHLVGHSYGGYLAATVAVRRPEAARSLTMIEPTLFHLLAPAGETAAHDEILGVARRTSGLTQTGQTEAAARAFLDYWVGPGALDAMPEANREAVIATMEKLQHEWPFAGFEGLPSLSEIGAIEVPVHVVRAKGTTAAAAAVVALLRRALPGATFSQIDGAGHMSPVTHPGKVNPLIAAFLNRHR